MRDNERTKAKLVTPNNEGKACDAVVRFLETLIGETRIDIRHPEKDGVGPPVDLRLKLGTQEYAIEHTRIEPFENQIKTGWVFNQINDYIKRNLLGPLLGSAYYELHIPINVHLPERKKKRGQVLNNLVEWIRTNAQCLYERNSGRTRPAHSSIWADDYIKDTPPGFDCDFELLRWPDATLIRRKPGCLVMKFIPPDDNELEDLRIKRLRQAFSKKCPKLKCCKAEGARTVLVLESRDIILTKFDLIGNALPKLLEEYTDAPDEIYLVETAIPNLWCVRPIKRDDDHWPTVGMPRWGQPIYHPDKLPTQGMPKSYRDALGLDKLYTPHPREWVPVTFEEDELNDLM